MGDLGPEDKRQRREAQLQRVLKRMEEKLRQTWDDEPNTLQEIEEESQRIGEAIKEIIEEERLEDKGTGYAGSYLPCCCGSPARYIGAYVRRLVTRSGERRLLRAYYHCRRCRKGFCPLDALLGGTSGCFSVEVCALATRFSSYLPFAQACREMEEVCGIRLSASSMRRIALSSGRQLEKDWSAKEAALWQEEENVAGGAVPPHRVKQLHVSLDGVMVYAGGEWREAKRGVAYQKKEEQIRANYYATLAKSDAFGRRLRTLAHVSGADHCANVGVVADGSVWIWQEAGKYFSTKTQVLDFYHVSEHLWKLGRVRFGDRTPAEREKAAVWVARQKERLLEDEAEGVIRSIARWKAKTQEQRDEQRKVLAYLREHRRRLRYKTFLAQGWHIGSGVMEAGCKAVVQSRMKGAGMRWSQAGAQAMLHLRAAVCSVNRPDFIDLARRATIPA